MELISSLPFTTKIPRKVRFTASMSLPWHKFFFESLSELSVKEYDDDTTIIPRSTSVIARRLPAARSGKGGAARYVSGKMPVNARSSSRAESLGPNRSTNGVAPASNSISDLNGAQSEDERIRALFSLQETQWKEQQEEMAK